MWRPFSSSERARVRTWIPFLPARSGRRSMIGHSDDAHGVLRRADWIAPSGPRVGHLGEPAVVGGGPGEEGIRWSSAARRTSPVRSSRPVGSTGVRAGVGTGTRAPTSRATGSRRSPPTARAVAGSSNTPRSIADHHARRAGPIATPTAARRRHAVLAVVTAVVGEHLGGGRGVPPRSAVPRARSINRSSRAWWLVAGRCPRVRGAARGSWSARLAGISRRAMPVSVR